MPFARPTLADLKAQVAADVQANQQGVSALLRFAVLRVITVVQAGLAFLHYGYLDWIAKQAVPWTATDEYQAAWGALKNVFQKGATAASGTVTFTGAPNTPLPIGTPIVRGDNRTYTTSAAATVGAGGTVVVTAADVSTGAAGNCDIGTAMALGTAIPGIQSAGTVTTAFTGGADVETPAAFGSRIISAFQQSPQGGAKTDYQTWALQVPGVTRAWVTPNGFGAGTVVVYVMLDSAESSHGGFPQGSNGVAAADSARGTVATGDQLTVANYIYPLQPVTALVYACSPVANAINFTIANLTSASAATKAAISAAISGVLLSNGAPGGTINLSDIESAISAISGTQGFVITSPTGNITNTAGQLPTLGTVTYP